MNFFNPFAAIFGPSVSGGGVSGQPIVLYAETTGDDGTASPGDPSKPFTVQGAYEYAMDDVYERAFIIMCGEGDHGTLVLGTSGFLPRISIRGIGYHLSKLTGIDGVGSNGANGSSHATSPTSGTSGASGKNATIFSDGSINLGTINLSGGNAGSSGSYSSDAPEGAAGSNGANGAAGGASGSLQMVNAVYDEIILNSGNGSDGRQGQNGGVGTGVSPSGDGGNGGDGGSSGPLGGLTLHGCKCTASGGGNISMKRGTPGSAGSAGSAGNDLGGGSGSSGSAGGSGESPLIPAAVVKILGSNIGELDFDSTTGGDQVMAATLFTSITIDGSSVPGVGADIGGNYESFEYHKLP